MNYLYNVALSFATEEKALVETVYHYLKIEGLTVFFAPAPECQVVLSGENQREIFYRTFGLDAEYVALFVSKHYVIRDVPMEEANIAFSKHRDDGKVIPVYLDGTPLPSTLLNPQITNYFTSSNPAEISSHIVEKIKSKIGHENINPTSTRNGNVMNIQGNTADKQIFVQTFNGKIEL